MIEILDSNLKKVDILRKYTFSQYVDKFREVGTFKLNVRMEKENLYLMDETEQYYVLFDGKTFGRIDKVKKDSDSEFEKVLEITGQLAPVLFMERVVNGMLTFSGNTAQYVRELIYQNVVKDATKNRYVNIDIQYDDETYLNGICSKVDKQTTGGYVWDEVQPVLEQDKLGIFFTPIVKTKHIVDGVETNISEWELKISAGKDRRKGNKQGNRPVVFSQSLSNIARTTYDHETEKYKNIAYVAGEGEEQERKWYEIGINAGVEIKNKKGWGCRELWIDARDIQSEDSDGNKITSEEYEKLIKQRANEKATENTVERSYSSTLTEANNQYEYGKDYYKGDFVTVIDNELGITVDAQVTEATVTEEGTRKVIDIDFTYGKINRDPVEQIKNVIQKSETNDSNIKYLENKTKTQGEVLNTKPSYGERELLWSGTLAKGKTANLGSDNWKKYNLFMARTSDGATVMIGMRYDSGGSALIRFVGGYDDGNKSYLFKANTAINISTNNFINISTSRHKYLTSGSGAGDSQVLDLVELWGII